MPIWKVVATVEGMDNHQAQQSLTEARAAYAASSRPVIPVVLGVVCAIAAGAGVALLGQSPDRGSLRALLLAGGVALIVVAFLLPARYRSRRGLHGFRGRVQSDNLVFLLCAAALFIIGLNADRTLSHIYIGIGAFVAVAYFLLLRGHSGRSE